MLLTPVAAFSEPQTFDYAGPQYGVSLSRETPAFTEFTVDPLKKGHLKVGNVLPIKLSGTGYKFEATGKSFSYVSGQSSNWLVECKPGSLVLSSKFHPGETPQPFQLLFHQKQCHATLLGLMPKDLRAVTSPCVLHLPGEGSFLVQSATPGVVGYDARRYVDAPFVKVEFPPADASHPEVSYRLDPKAFYRPLPGMANDEKFDGYRRDSLTIFQLNPREGVLANNSSSDPVSFTLFEYTEAAKFAPRLAPGLSLWDVVRQTLERYSAGVKGYGQAGYGNDGRGADLVPWSAPYDSADTNPSLLMAGCDYVQATKDLTWAKKYYKSLKSWFNVIAESDHAGTGLTEFARTGNYNDRPKPDRRPANWWDCINFGYHDAYSNALAYQAARKFAVVASKVGEKDDATKATTFADRLRKVYVSEFYNPETGMLAGWRSKDGALHDYAFPFVNGAAVVYGLVDQKLGNQIMDKVMAKMKSVGFNRFDLGIPGNLIPVRKGDYTQHNWAGSKGVGEPELEDGTDAFQFYENGGATSSFAYFTVKALYQLGRIEDARKIFLPMLESFRTGEFMGFGPNGQSKDWRDWNGGCHGYEGLLVDGFLPLTCVPDELKSRR